MITIFILLSIAYLFGSLSSAIIVSKIMGLPDPRTSGSHNPGTTNVLRVGGKLPAIITLLGDALKGLIPVLLAKALNIGLFWTGIVGLAAFLGHLFPLFFRFKGGKGLATFLGVLLALNWIAGIATLVTWLLVALISRYSSLAALISTALSPFYLAYWGKSIYVVPVILMVVILFLRHKANIERLMAGKESRLFGK